jgi:hypothetical protein
MAEEKPSLHIDTDWKKQAQEEKRRLAEDEQKRAAERAAAPTTAAAPGMGAGAAAAGSTAGPARGRPGSPSGAARERGVPEASFSALANSLATQALLYLGVLAPRGVEPEVNLDLAKFNIDLLGVLEEKSKNNLTPDEQKLIDTVLYEVRSRYVAVASHYATV